MALNRKFRRLVGRRAGGGGWEAEVGGGAVSSPPFTRGEYDHRRAERGQTAWGGGGRRGRPDVAEQPLEAAPIAERIGEHSLHQSGSPDPPPSRRSRRWILAAAAAAVAITGVATLAVLGNDSPAEPHPAYGPVACAAGEDSRTAAFDSTLSFRTLREELGDAQPTELRVFYVVTTVDVRDEDGRVGSGKHIAEYDRPGWNNAASQSTSLSVPLDRVPSGRLTCIPQIEVVDQSRCYKNRCDL